jgi:hypothetical protein
MAKATKKAARKINAKFLASVNAASDMGYDMADGYSRAVELVRSVKASANALADVAANYVIGYVARSLSSQLGNMERVQQYAEARDIIAKAGPDTSKPDRRTAEQHKAVRAAQTSLASVKRAAGIAPSKAGGRKPRAGSNPPEPPRDALFASPKLANDNEARDYFRNAFAALLTTTEVNRQTGIKKEVKHVAFVVQSIIQDAKAAIEKALA